jgi:hypothetical protein
MKWTAKTIHSFMESKEIGMRHFQDSLGLTKVQILSVVESGTSDPKIVQILDWLESNEASNGSSVLAELKAIFKFNNPQLAAYLGWSVSKLNRALRGDSLLEPSEYRFVCVLLDDPSIREKLSGREYG